ncbi:MAG: hypothetical protein JWO90_1, partial [Solirubrobacterales bacterium]|nr:hypothetical protein [Solirubrobacterales bacterium]
MSCSSSARRWRLGATGLLTCVAAALPATAAQGAGPTVRVSVFGPNGTVVKAPTTVGAREARLRVESRTCPAPSATPLAALAQLRLPMGITAGGGCSPSAMFVRRIASTTNRGRDGWAYKVGRRAGTASAASTSGSFGNGRRLRSGDVVTWFWCKLGARGCQRTLTAVRAGTRTVRVMGYDDEGRGVRVRSAIVTVRSSTGRSAAARTDARGLARVTLGGSWRVAAR